MRKRSRGQTLTEVLVGAAVFTIVLTVATDFLARAVQSTTAGEVRGTALDQGTTALYRMSDEIQQSTAVLEPNQAVLAQGAGYLVLQTENDTVAYRLAQDPGGSPQQVVQRQVYEPGYPGRQVVMPDGTRYLTSTASVLQFSVGTAPGAGNSIQMVLTITPPNASPVTLRTTKTPWIDVVAGLGG